MGRLPPDSPCPVAVQKKQLWALSTIAYLLDGGYAMQVVVVIFRLSFVNRVHGRAQADGISTEIASELHTIDRITAASPPMHFQFPSRSFCEMVARTTGFASDPFRPARCCACRGSVRVSYARNPERPLVIRQGCPSRYDMTQHMQRSDRDGQFQRTTLASWDGSNSTFCWHLPMPTCMATQHGSKLGIAPMPRAKTPDVKGAGTGAWDSDVLLPADAGLFI